MTFNLNQKSALITGASGGIGKAIAETFHKHGANVILVGRNESALNKVKDSLKERASVIVADFNNQDDITSLIKQAEAISPIDILVCNAGITKDMLALRMKDEDWNQVLNINLTAVFKLNRDALGFMMKRRYGRIINISSIIGVTGNFGQANYAASKAGMIGMTKSLALETASRGITVNCVAPGYIDTPMTQVMPEESKQLIISKVPAKRMGLPLDIAYTSLYLASEEASYVTGQTIHVNGGLAMV